MNAVALAELALKIGGVFLVLGALLSFPSAVWMIASLPSGDPQAALVRAAQVGSMFGLLISGAGGIAILVWADRLVALFESDVTRLHIDVSRAELQRLAFAVVGVFILIDGLQNTALAGSVLLRKPDEAETWSYVWSRQGEAMIKGLVRIAAATILIVGREALTRGWSRMRGQADSDFDESEDPDGEPGGRS